MLKITDSKGKVKFVLKDEDTEPEWSMDKVCEKCGRKDTCKSPRCSTEDLKDEDKLKEVE